MNPSTMTPQEKREVLATRLMGWVWHSDVNLWRKQICNGQPVFFDPFPHKKFKPDGDENHFRMVLEEIMKDEKLFKKFASSLPTTQCEWMLREDDSLLWNYMKAPLLKRVNAAISVIPERDE